MGEIIEGLFFNEDSYIATDIWILSIIIGAILGGIFLNRPINYLLSKMFTTSAKISKNTISQVAENPKRTASSMLLALGTLASGILFGLFTAVLVTYLVLGTSIGRSLFSRLCTGDYCGLALWGLATYVPILSFVMGFVIGLYLGDKYLKSLD
ncbi:MAG TPA: hypothetical protein ENH82_20295 [bacterium]|nr:hypothetical protein [bacterium]